MVVRVLPGRDIIGHLCQSIDNDEDSIIPMGFKGIRLRGHSIREFYDKVIETKPQGLVNV